MTVDAVPRSKRNETRANEGGQRGGRRGRRRVKGRAFDVFTYIQSRYVLEVVPSSGRPQWPREILQGAMFTSFSILNYHIGSGTSSVCQLLLSVSFIHALSRSLLRSIFYAAFLHRLEHPFFLCVLLLLLSFPLSPSRIAPFPSFLLRVSLPSPPHFRKPRTRHVFILSRSVRRLFHRLPSGIMHLKRRRLKDRRLCVPCSEFLDIN